MSTTASVAVRVNEKKLIANLGYTFSNSYTVLSEPIRRAIALAEAKLSREAQA